MLDLETAIARILATLPLPQREAVPLSEAAERVLLESVSSPVDLPPFDNSAMDGYAVRAAEVRGATPTSPVRLRVRTKIPAGGHFPGELAPGECARLFTGSPLPGGADAVVMQEDTRSDSGQPNEILICDSVAAGEYVRRRGEDVQRGGQIVAAGTVLAPGVISLLSATGITQVGVGRQPVVCLLATGSELREAGQPLAPGQIYESNRAMLAALVNRAGGVPEIFPLVPDNLAATQSALERAFSESELVITSGGVSVGEMDFVKAALEALGGELQFWKVAMRPGKPFVFGRLGEKFLFGLPGNPVSAFVTFLLLVRPALQHWQGALDVALPIQRGVLGEVISNSGDRRHFMRVRMDRDGNVFSAGKQASHALASLAAADGLLDVPPATRLATGTKVSVLRWT